MESLNYHNVDGLLQLCASGELDMHEPLELTNHMKNQRVQMTILKHFLILCRSDKCSLIHILSRLRCMIQTSLLDLIQKNSLVKQYILSTIQEWRQSFPPEDLFLDGLDQCGYSEGDDLFSYDELLKERECSQKGGSQMKAIEGILKQRQDNYTPLTSDFAGQMKLKLQDLQNECTMCINRVKQHTVDTMDKQKMMNPIHMDILLDLASKPKSLYIEYSNHIQPNNEVFDMFMSQSVGLDIPENIHTIFLNYTITLNMIKKELNYISNSFKDILQYMRPHMEVLGRITGDIDILTIDEPLDGDKLTEELVLTESPPKVAESSPKVAENPIFSFF